MFLFSQLWGFSEFPQGLWVVEGGGENTGPCFPTPPSKEQLCLYFLHIGFPQKLSFWLDPGSHENLVWVGNPFRLYQAFPFTSPSTPEVVLHSIPLLDSWISCPNFSRLTLPYSLATRITTTANVYQTPSTWQVLSSVFLHQLLHECSQHSYVFHDCPHF